MSLNNKVKCPEQIRENEDFNIRITLSFLIFLVSTIWLIPEIYNKCVYDWPTGWMAFTMFFQISLLFIDVELPLKRKLVK